VLEVGAGAEAAAAVEAGGEAAIRPVPVPARQVRRRKGKEAGTRGYLGVCL